MIHVQPLTLLTSSSAKWTQTQEKAITRDYPFTDLHLESPDQFVVRTYLQFLWLPESIMPINLLVPSLKRVQDISSGTRDTPHPLHTLLDQLLLSVRSVATKYNVDLPQILEQNGGGGEIEESMMWFALNYEMGEGEEGGASVNSEDAVMLEEKSRNMWLERLERREVQIQILLYLLKLSLPGPCTPLPAVTIPASTMGVVPTKKKRRKERAKVVTPSPHERLETFMDKLSMWQLVTTMKGADTITNKSRDKRDWMQVFCEDVVEREFNSTMPDMCALLRNKVFPHSPFSDDDHDTDQRSSPGPQAAGSANPRPNRKLVRSSTSASISQSKSKPNPKPDQRSSSILSQTSASDSRARSRSLSVSLAQDASVRRSNSIIGTASSLKRALSREVSMSRGFKHRAQQSQASQSQIEGTGVGAGTSTKVLAKPKKEVKRVESQSQGVTLVVATPTKPRDVKTQRYASTESQGQIPSPNFSFSLDTHVEDEELANGGDTDSEGVPEVVNDEEEELWLPTSSPDILLLGGRKRTASGSSSSFGFSDPGDEGGTDTPVKKRKRI